MGIFRFDRDGRISAFEEKPNALRLAEIGQSVPRGSMTAGAHSPDKPFLASMGVCVFSREVLMELLAASDATDFGREVIPSALDKVPRECVHVPRLLGRCRYGAVVP